MVVVVIGVVVVVERMKVAFVEKMLRSGQLRSAAEELRSRGVEKRMMRMMMMRRMRMRRSVT